MKTLAYSSVSVNLSQGLKKNHENIPKSAAFSFCVRYLMSEQCERFNDSEHNYEK